MNELIKMILDSMPKVNEIKSMTDRDRLWLIAITAAHYFMWALFLWFLVKVIGFKLMLG